MRLVCLVIGVAILGAFLGIAHSRSQFSGVEERFELPIGLVANDERPAQGAAVGDLQESPRGEPAVVIVGESHNDFGVLRHEQSRSHQFVIRNDGDVDLQVEKHNVSCGLCVVTAFTSAIVKPGAELEIPVTLNARKPGPELNEALEIRTNDKLHEVIRFELLAYVSDPVGASVRELALGTISTDEGAESSFNIYGFEDGPLLVKECHPSDLPNKSFFEVELRDLTVEELKAEQSHAKFGKQVKLMIKPGLPVGPLEQSLKIVASSGEDVTLSVSVVGKVAGDLALIGGSKFSPDKSVLSLGRLNAGEESTATLHLMVKGKHRDSVKVTVGDCDPAGHLSAAIGERKSIRNGTAYLIPIVVSVAKDTPPMNRLGGVSTSYGEIMLHTTHPVAKEVRLQVRFAVE